MTSIGLNFLLKAPLGMGCCCHPDSEAQSQNYSPTSVVVRCKRGTPFFLRDNYTCFVCALKICIRGFFLFVSYYF